jgi:hypothetical protein
MTSPGKDLPLDDDAPLAAEEGVNEGSATSTQEATGVPNPVNQLLGDPEESTRAAGTEPASPPDDMETAESRAAREARGTGQQLEAGEG